ncbi:MAG: DUF1553 domain-containing protein [Planctomycetes bacterium]|nr:DUF1553 domain-containing protein [Planctomycetota bacterium]
MRFNEQIRPILAEHCLHCHGPDENNREGDLRLDLFPSANENVLVPHKPDESELFLRITSEDADLVMPPLKTGKPLSAEQIAVLRQWIEEGAQYQGHWAFEPISKPKLPPPDKSAGNAIDRLILASLQSQELTLSPAISRTQLIRRATFDLTGLPPSWQDVEAFVQDESPQAFEKVVDRLLDSPQYGERWGRHWLDIARYADTHGGSAIGFKKFPFSYTYRDYVIQAFNSDLPYNRFVIEQLAADQLELEENDPALAGLGFLTVGMQYRNRNDLMDDQIDVVTRGLLGLTVACARCHDHKFDAIPTKDYYSLYATLASSRSPDLLPVLGNPPDSPPYQKYQQELAHRQELHDTMARDQNAVMRSRLRMQVGLYLTELAKGTPEQDLSSAFLSYRTDDVRPLVLNRWRKYLAEMSDQDPVFGLWVQLSKLEANDFPQRSVELIQSLVQENGDLKKLPAMQKFDTDAPRWNPRVLEVVLKKKPQSMLDVAAAYGKLFADVHQQWLHLLIETSLESRSSADIVPDEDLRHLEVNSPINRQLRRHLYAPETPTAMTDKLAQTILNRTVHDKVVARKKAIHDLHLSSPGSPPRGMTLREDKQAHDFHVFLRGSPMNRGEPVQARFLTALSGPDEQPFDVGKRRLGLAQAIVDPANPMTRRVIVNWVWQHHFGQGLVRTPDNFGTRGQPPTHPQLLDYLAATFMEDGWSLKKLHRRIMLTAVYQQAAREDAASRKKDPDNKRLWRMPRRKLDLEAMRDSLLAVAGELSTTMGGHPFEFLAEPVIPRRSVYAFVNRDIISSMASTFDGANSSSCTAKRAETNVPQQTLFALNSEFIQDRAVALASLPEIAAAKTEEERVRKLYQRVFSRSPDPQEVETALSYIHSQDQQESETDPWHRLAHVLLAANEFVFVD